MREVLRRYARGLALLAALLVSVPALAESEAFNQLLENVKYWEGRGRPDKAAEIWRKILRSDPRHPKALVALTLRYARTNRKKEARTYLDRLIKHHPNHSRIASLKQAVGLGNKFDSLLAEARDHAKSGRVEEAIAAYRKLFGRSPPSGKIGLEYYQTLPAKGSGWQEAHKGLERLAKANKGAPAYELAFARHLTYREQTRRAGISRLERLAKQGGRVGKSARKSWKRALLWVRATTKADRKVFRTYLAAYPNDAEVTKRLEELTAGAAPKGPTGDPDKERIGDGYEALEAADVKTAEKLFEQAVKRRRKSVDALVGLATVALQKEEFPKARQLLEQVKKLAPKRRELWERSLESAEFWELVQTAKKARAEKRYDQAAELLRKAAERSGSQSHHAWLVLANVLVDRGDLPEAEVVMKRLLEAQPDSPDVLRASVELYLTLGQGSDAIETNQRLAALAPDKAYDESWLVAETMRRDAAKRRDAGDLDGAREGLRAARQVSPENKRVAYELAYLALSLGDAVETRSMIDQLRAMEGEESSNLKILEAHLAERAGDFALSLELLEAVPADDLDANTVRLRDRAKVRAVTAMALKLGQRKPIAARYRLIELQTQVGNDPDLLGEVAIAWAKFGSPDRALEIIYDALARAPRRSSALKLQLASVLHEAGHDEELLAVLHELETDPGLSILERRGLADLRIAHAVRRADQARERGDPSRSFAILSAPLRDYPNDPRLMNALARLFVSASEYQEALRVFVHVLDEQPNNLEARQGAIHSGIKMGRDGLVDKLLAEGMERQPNLPRMHLVAARAAVMRGEDGDAMGHYKRALALAETQNRSTRVRRGGLGDSTYRSLVAGAASRFGGGGSGSGGSPGGADLNVLSEIMAEIDELESRHSSGVGASFDFRYRNGVAGMGQLLEMRIPISLGMPIGYKGRLTFEAVPTVLEPGTLDLDNPFTQSNFGTTGVDLFGTASGDHDQSAVGLELGLGFKYRTFTIRAGSTPLGFPIQTVVGGIEWRDQLGAVGLRLDLSRAPVTDSVLSYAGARDVATGATWGGVTRNGGRFDFAFDDDPMLYYVYAAGHVDIGERVPVNPGGEVGLGVNWTLHDWEQLKLTAGLAATGLFFKQNLRFFTLGGGGYFSPQRFVNAGVPLRFSVDGEKVKFRLGADLGVNWFHEDAARYYPEDEQRQELREGLTGKDDLPVESVHPSQDSFAFALNAEASLSWEISSSFDLGIRAKFHTGHDFRELVGGIVASYSFEKKQRRAFEKEQRRAFVKDRPYKLKLDGLKSEPKDGPSSTRP